MAAANTVLTDTKEIERLVEPYTLLGIIADRWRKNNKRQSVRPLKMGDLSIHPAPLCVCPAWPGTGEVTGMCDQIPMVIIPHMPTSCYPENVKALAAYTMAELFLSQPHLASYRRDASLNHMVILTVVGRCAAWAAMGRTPVTTLGVSSQAVRWSPSHGTMIVRPGATSDGTALWRHFLAISPGQLEGAGEVMAAMTGLGPMLVLSGANQTLRSGEVYAMHYLEREMANSARATLSRKVIDAYRLEDTVSWDLLAAAAIGGYSASVIQHVSNDPAFITDAQIRLTPTDRAILTCRLEKIKPAGGFTDLSVMGDIVGSVRAPREVLDVDDSVSVADTEAGEYQAGIMENDPINRFLNDLDTAETPRPSSPTEDPPQIPARAIGEIRDILRDTTARGPAVISLAGGPEPDESVRWE